MTWLMLGTGLALVWLGFGIQIAEPRRRQLGRLFEAAGQAVLAILDFRIHQAIGALNAMACAYCLWRWWNGGGGNDTKRRLRKLRTRFAGVRRTAPAAAMAVAS